MTNILLLEDHKETAHWLHDIAMDAFADACVMHAYCLADARHWLGRQQFQLALLDIHLPDGNGIDLISEIRAHNANTLLAMTTIFDDDQHLFDALRAGAQGYLLKEQSHDELVAKLRGIRRGEPPLSPGIARRLLAYFNPATSVPSFADSLHRTGLSPRERQTLTLLAKGYSIKELSRLLEISEHTAAGYAKSIYRKLNISSRAEATLEASRLGLVRV